MPFIKLEMGYRGGLTPHSLIPITSYVAEALTAAGEKGTYLDLQTFEVKVLAPERTLVEKLFALHGAYEKGEIEKRVRHYYDVYHLLDLSEVISFLETDEYKALKQDVHSFSVTAHALNEEREKALSLGFSDYITKPIQRKNLIATLNKYKNERTCKTK